MSLPCRHRRAPACAASSMVPYRFYWTEQEGCISSPPMLNVQADKAYFVNVQPASNSMVPS